MVSIQHTNDKQRATVDTIWQILETVTDPEIPVLTIQDLGIVRAVDIHDDGGVTITITPTYTGCPAMDMIAMNIRLALAAYKNVTIKSVLSPAWTTDWMTETGKAKLQQYGIAPPKGYAGQIPADGVECPQCHSTHTKLLSEFSSTACKALYQCQDCKEPFDYFKCH
jgi:ring-1,2-phenylacetyl-CoA epoxidase subunit PaaD